MTKTAKGTDMVTHDEDPLLTMSEVARRIGRSPSTIQRWVRDGLLKPVRDPSGLSRIRQSTVDAFYSATALAEVAAEKEERGRKANEAMRKQREKLEMENLERQEALEAELRLLEGGNKGTMSREDVQTRRMKQYEETRNGQTVISRDGTGSSPG
jgi:excisionase family DNA binding protein